MKILQVVHGFPPHNMGGAELYAYNLSHELAKRHKVSIFHRINDLHQKDYTVTRKNFEGLDIFTINNTFRLYSSFRDTYKNNTIAEKFTSVLETTKPDIVHIQHLLYLGAELIEEIKKRKIPIVFTLHDYWLFCPQGQLFKDNKENCDRQIFSECIDCIIHHLSIRRRIFDIYYFSQKILPVSFFQLLKNIYLTYCKFCSPKNEALNLLNERLIYIKDICSKVDLFIAPSKFLRSKFVEFGVPEDKIVFLSYGLNLDRFKDFQKIPSTKLRFAFIANLLPAKGAHILIECFNKIGDENVELKIYGRVASCKGKLGNYLNYLKKITKNKNIKFMGGFDNREVAKIFREIDVLIVPSIWQEVSPIVIMEAFATKTVVIASDIGGIPESIKDGINGFLFKPGNINDLHKKIDLIIKNPSIIEKIKQNIKFPKNIEENTKEIESLYKNLLINTGGPVGVAL